MVPGTGLEPVRSFDQRILSRVSAQICANSHNTIQQNQYLISLDLFEFCHVCLLSVPNMCQIHCALAQRSFNPLCEIVERARYYAGFFVLG